MDDHILPVESIENKNDSTVSPPSANKETDGDFFKTAQSILSFAVGLVGLLTASGFIIVNVYLSEFTHIQGYSVNTTQYLAASIGASFWIIASFVISLIFDYIIFTLSFLYWLIRLLFRNERKEAPSHKKPIEKLYKDIVFPILHPTKRPLLTLYWWFFIVLLSLLYGYLFYGQIPYYFGGGKPVPIYIVFHDAKDVSSFGFTSISNHPNVVYGVEKVAELSDGILVYDWQNKFTAIVKNEEIAGILDYESTTLLWNKLNAPDAEATETPTAEATAAQTAAP